MLTLEFLVKLYSINTSMSGEAYKNQSVAVTPGEFPPLPKTIIYLKTFDKKFNAKKKVLQCQINIM